MTVLAPMRPDYFGTFSERTIAGYADDNVSSFRWDEAAALERARVHFQKLLPHGMLTTGHHLYEILDRPNGKTVGGLWFEILQGPQQHSAHLYDLYVDREFRRAHHAKAALALVEARCRELGAVIAEILG